MNAGVPCRMPCAESIVASCPGLILDDAEIQHLQVVVLEPEARDEEVGGLDVAVHEPVLVRFGERPARLAQQHDHALGRLRPEARDDALEIEPVEQLHHVIEAAAVVDAEVVELHGVRRPQAGGHLRLALEAADELLARRARLHVVTNQLHRRGPREEPVLAEPDLAHPARSQRRHETIAADREPLVEQLLVDLEHACSRDTRTARSSTERSSRMLPGHVYASSRRIDSGDTPSTTLPSCRACRRTK